MAYKKIIRKISLLVILLFCGIMVSAQDNESRKDRFADAEYLYLNDDISKALQMFKRLSVEEPDNANIQYRVGLCYLKLPFENGRSIPYLKRAITNTTAKYKEGSYKEIRAPFESFYWLGYALHNNKYFDQALLYYKKYRDTIDVSEILNIAMVDRQIESCQAAKDLMKHPVDAEITNLGNIVNTKSAEINPAISADGKTIVFTRFQMAKVDSLNINRIQDKKSTIFETHLGADGRWSTPVNISSQLKNFGTAQTISLSPDGTQLLLFNDDSEKGGPLRLRQGSIYSSQKKDGKWSPMVKLNKNINSFAWETHASLSTDGKELFFTSDRKGGYGGLDIYVSKLINGTWGPAVNLGPSINTKYDEETPTLLQDGKTLFFSSEGHNNMGGFDVFYSKKIDSVTWSEPVNLGYPINSPGENLFYIPIDNGEKAIYSAARYDGYLTFGNEDLYMIDIITNPNQYPSIELTGKLRCEDFNDLDTSATIIVYDTTNMKEIARTKPDIKTGTFSCTMRPGNYIVLCSATDYKTEKRFVSLPRVRRPTPVMLNVGLIPTVVKEKKYYEIRNIYFDFNKSTMNREMQIIVENLFVTMNENPGLYLEVVGHCDSRGTDAYNKKLSGLRARAVIDYLVAKGIEEQRFVSKGEGKQLPVAIDKNKNGSVNEEGARLNRRVEIRVLKSNNDMIVSLDETIPDHLRFNQFNRFSVLVLEDAVLYPMTRFDTLKTDLKEVFVIPTPKGYAYYGGDFKTAALASKALNGVVKKGFSEARIVDYFFINKLNRFVVTNKIDWPRKYTIQLKAIDEQVMSDFKGMTDVQETKTADGYYRYTYKEFLSLDDAKTELAKVIEKGFINAFVIDKAKLK